jgi:hypothetical protein
MRTASPGSYPPARTGLSGTYTDPISPACHRFQRILAAAAPLGLLPQWALAAGRRDCRVGQPLGHLGRPALPHLGVGERNIGPSGVPFLHRHRRLPVPEQHGHRGRALGGHPVGRRAHLKARLRGPVRRVEAQVALLAPAGPQHGRTDTLGPADLVIQR